MIEVSRKISSERASAADLARIARGQWGIESVGDGNFLASTSTTLTENVDTSLKSYPKLSNSDYNLSNANFTGANFTGANLTGANPKGAVGLSGATLTNVIWSRTECPDGTLSNNDGGTCIGHLSPAQPSSSYPP